jgi:hypothetical protein
MTVEIEGKRVDSWDDESGWKTIERDLHWLEIEIEHLRPWKLDSFRDFHDDDYRL